MQLSWNALPLLFALLLASQAGGVRAQDREDERYARLPEAVRRVEQETGGKVLQVRPIQRGDREVFRMKVLTPDGRVKIVQDDPKRRRDAERERARTDPPEPTEPAEDER